MPLTADAPAGSEPAIDFTMSPYQAPWEPVDRALASAAVLAASAARALAGQELCAVAGRVQRTLGRGRTIWAAIWTPSGVSWELYWYNGRGRSLVTTHDVRDVLGDLVEFDLPHGLPSRPDVVSIDLGAEELTGRAPVDHVNIYSGNPAATVRSGTCHRFDSSGISMTAVYYCFPAESLPAAERQKEASIHLRGRQFWPETVQCTTIHISNKVNRDAVYYGGITTDQLVAFLARTSYEPWFTSAIAQRSQRLRHLRFDVGTDFSLHRSDPVKLAVYGVL